MKNTQSSWLGLLRKSVSAWHRLETFSLIAILIAISVLVFFEVLVRNLNLPVQMRGVEEISLILLIWLTFLGAAICQRDNSHLRVDIFAKALPPAFRGALMLLINIGILLFLVLTIKGSIPLMGQAMVAKTSVLEWPAVIWPAAVFVGMGLSVVYFVTGHAAGLTNWIRRRLNWKD